MSKRSMGSSELYVHLAVLLSVVAGCNRHPDLHVVRGRVQYADGTPVTFGTVELLFSFGEAIVPRFDSKGWDL